MGRNAPSLGVTGALRSDPLTSLGKSISIGLERMLVRPACISNNQGSMSGNGRKKSHRLGETSGGHGAWPSGLQQETNKTPIKKFSASSRI